MDIIRHYYLWNFKFPFFHKIIFIQFPQTVRKLIRLLLFPLLQPLFFCLHRYNSPFTPLISVQFRVLIFTHGSFQTVCPPRNISCTVRQKPAGRPPPPPICPASKKAPAYLPFSTQVPFPYSY